MLCLIGAWELWVWVYKDSFLYQPGPANFVLLNSVLKKLWSHLWSNHNCQMQSDGHHWGLEQGNFIGCRRVFVAYLGCFGAWTDAGAGCMRFDNGSHEDFPIRQVVPVGLRCTQDHRWVPWGGFSWCKQCILLEIALVQVIDSLLCAGGGMIGWMAVDSMGWCPRCDILS